MTEHSFYSAQIKKYTEIQEKAARKVVILGSLRLAVFLSVFFLWFFLIGTSLIWWITVLGIASFLYLIHLSADARYEKVRAEKMVQINENELQARDGDWSCFKDGSSYHNPAHPFASDMDLFGPKSLFQLVNRTVSKKGERLLAMQLSEGTTDVALTSAAIRELSHETDWAQSVLAEGMVFLDSDGELAL